LLIIKSCALKIVHAIIKSFFFSSSLFSLFKWTMKLFNFVTIGFSILLVDDEKDIVEFLKYPDQSTLGEF